MVHYNEDYSRALDKGPPVNALGVRVPDVNRVRDEDGCLVVWMFGRNRPPAERELLEYVP